MTNLNAQASINDHDRPRFAFDPSRLSAKAATGPRQSKPEAAGASKSLEVKQTVVNVPMLQNLHNARHSAGPPSAEAIAAAGRRNRDWALERPAAGGHTANCAEGLRLAQPGSHRVTVHLVTRQTVPSRTDDITSTFVPTARPPAYPQATRARRLGQTSGPVQCLAR